ncbi:hypothetical protein AVT69_gp230 [Pseudomonas phage PhiPA3]|uniref:Uncharacterized protein 232 n=1 Tax=Pseudomonas phage PhiPA3 TaxID=998086 RepID=F8SJ75_BPPA3|nr:hypothetical protein AVT69_gp230 [Pseudomonas phage PhiPA3]AEH03655.1 hypothetical protein [Pseudomonas phage PhiPA3]
MSVYEQMTNQPDRKCRSETLLRLLISTSYPHATLADLTFAFSNHSGQKDLDELEKIAIQMKDVERSFDMFDFIRCIELKRQGEQIQIQVKRLDFDPTMRTLEDSSDTHEAMATSSVHLTDERVNLADVDVLATRLLEIFYRSQVKVKKKGNEIATTVWKSRTKHIDRRNPKAETKVVEAELDFQAAIEMISTSLRKRRFHILLTQNTILLLDQKSRIWGVSKA